MFLGNHWYVAARGDHVGRVPLVRVLLEMHRVIRRDHGEEQRIER